MQENVLAEISECLTISFPFSFLYDSIFCITLYYFLI